MHWYSIWVKKAILFSCFPVLPGSAEAQVIWGSTVKRLLIASLLVTFLPKKYENVFTYVKVIANQRWDVFWDTVDIRLNNVHFCCKSMQRNLLKGLCLLCPPKRAGHYIMMMWFLRSSFFPRLFSAVADWMSTILRHMMWPYTVSQKGCHPIHGYNFVNSWSICKILSLLQRALNFQQNSFRLLTAS